MKTIKTLLSKLNDHNIKLWVKDGKLRCQAPDGTLTAELKVEIAENKTEIIRFLEPEEIPPIPIAPKDKELTLSFAQQRLWFLAQLEGESSAYNMPAALHLSGKLDETALQQALIDLVQRHESLRLCFPTVNGEATVQLVEVYNPLSTTDLTALSEAEQKNKVSEWIERHAQTPFKLSTGPLLSLYLLKIGREAQILLFNMHHIISDGWSMSVLIRELSKLYTSHTLNQEPQLPKLEIQYTDYAAWQRNWLEGEVLEQQRAYWSKKLAGAPELSQLPTDYPRPAVMRYQGKHTQSTIDEKLLTGIKQMSQQHGMTLFMTLLSSFKVLLYRYSGQNDLVIGSPVANRTHHQTENLIGFFVNTLILRTQINGQQTFQELLRQVKQTSFEAYAHQDIPFEYLVEQLNPTRSMSHPPLFQVMFILQNTPEEELKLGNLKIAQMEHENSTAKFDLTLNITEHENACICDWEYSTDMFHPDTINRMTEHFQILLNGILNNPEQLISQLPLLTVAEELQLQAWNQTKTNYPKNLTIVDLFQVQVEKTPKNIAVTFEGQQLSYQELNRKANQLAFYLKSLGVGTETLVGICMERSLEMVIGLLAILKAGGAYVPLDPGYPPTRLQFMLDDSSASVLLSQSHLLERAVISTEKVVCLDLKREQIAASPGNNPIRQSGPNDLAYVLFTSGSTGNPKGVMIEHKSTTTLIQWASETFSQEHLAGVLASTSINFDLSVYELFVPLCHGGQIFLVENALSLPTFKQSKAITLINTVPSAMAELLRIQGIPESVKVINLAGEPFKNNLAQTIYKNETIEFVYNLYGPSEDTTYSTSSLIPKGSNREVNIGRPIANTQIYILDVNHSPTPTGIPGELCIAGGGLARGYLNRPKLSAEKFIETVIFGKPQRLYKTGDLARWLSDGNLEYLGRIDHQVKLRGFRIELSEIEVTLCQQSAVKEAVVVIYNQENNPRLVAYITLANLIAPINDVPKVLRTWLKTRLPEYMMPSSFVVLDKLPLTPNGKIDRKALSRLDLDASVGTYEAPRTSTEQDLVEIWNQAMKQTNIGIFDNFFERGGDSILSIQIVARSRAVGLSLNTQDLFQHQTIAELAQVVLPLCATKEAEQGPITGDVPLTPIQQWFFATHPQEPWHFNQAFFLAASSDINEAALEQALAMILQHHDALRLRYRKTANGWVGWHDVVLMDELPYHIEDLSHLSKESQIQKLSERADFWQASLNLETGPLVRLVLFHLGNEFRLLWCIHHLAVDGVSWRILLEDLQIAYQQAVAGQSINLPAKTSSFKAWAENLYKWKKSESFVVQADYWRKLPNAKPLPIDNPAGRNRIGDIQRYTIHLTEAATQRLLTESYTAYSAQINDLLLTALTLTLRDWTGSKHHLIDLESHGRADLFEELDLSRTVGWFTSLYTISLQLPEEKELSIALKTIKEQLRKTPHEGVGYGVLRYLYWEELEQGQILFNYLGQFDQSLKESEFRFVDEERGCDYSLKGERNHLIEINGLIVDGRLSLTWSYSGDQYQEQTIQSLANNYLRQLQSLIELCANSYGYTPSDFPLAQLNQTQLDHLAQQYGNNIADIYPLSPMQQGMLFHSLYTPEKRIYFEQFSCSLSGQLNIEAFRQAWQYLINRHTILRTAFWHETDTPLQLVYKAAQLSWQTLDWREMSEKEHKQQLQSLLTTERSQGFELNQAPLMRLQLIQETDVKSRLVWHFHHILMDGWCLPILFTELFETYSSFTAGQTPCLQPMRPYLTYITWLSQQDHKSAKEYWQEQLKGFYAPTPLPISQHSKSEGEYQEVALTIKAQLNQQLKRFSRNHRLTLNTLIQGAWAALLSRYSGQNDVVFGAITSGRQIPIIGIDRMLGMFINTLPLRVNVDNNNILSGLQTIQQRQQQNNQYAYTALVDIQNWSDVPNGIALFDTIVVFENYPVDEKLNDKQHTGSLQITDLQSVEYTNYPITLAIIEGQELHFRLSYDSNRFQKDGIERMLAHLSRLLEGLIAQPDKSWHQLPMLSDIESQQLQAWNKTEIDYPKYKTIVELFEEQAEKTPNNIAVIFEKEELTYRQLNQEANQVAHYLFSLKREVDKSSLITNNCLVGICVESSLEMVVGLFGILKAGAAYLPLDPDYPPSRLELMLEDSSAPAILTQSHLLERLPITQKNGAKVICLDSEREQIAAGSIENPVRQSGPKHLAYVIYTSGSTGVPKGVMVEHDGLTNLIHAQTQAFNITQESRLLQFASFSFDASVSEIATTLTSGATLQLSLPNKFLSHEQFINLINIQSITHVTLPPSFLAALPQEKLPGIETMIVAGEACSLELATKWSKGRQFINAYGPTESTVCASLIDLTDYKGNGNPPSIGRPIANTRIYILDANHNLTPPGIPGELCIAGRGLARGYLNQHELTKAKFMEVVLLGKSERIYKTGDLARWLSDGNLEYLSRIDHQVKLRGFRIELGEIENALHQHHRINEAVVVHNPQDEKLNAYLVQKKRVELWPSIAEFYVYDDIVYHSMASHESRNQQYIEAFKGKLTGKTIVEVGPGPEVILSRLALEAGAEKIYAIELLEDTFNKAQETVTRMGLNDKIILIHGNATEVQLPEQVDYCISEIVGSIGGAEGAAVIINSVRRFLKDGNNMIPQRSLTKIAAISLPESWFDYSFTDIAAHYTQKIFKQVGYSFDLRLCVKNLPLTQLISNSDIFEDLDYTHHINLEATHEIKLEFDQNSLFTGLLVWLTLHTDADHIVDILKEQHSWLPVYIPLFTEGITVKPGDSLVATITRKLCDNRFNPDYLFEGTLYCQGKPALPIHYNSYHFNPNYRKQPFYQKLFADDIVPVLPKLDAGMFRDYLAQYLPNYMIPTHFNVLESLPLTQNGKINRKALSQLLGKIDLFEGEFIPPRTREEKLLADIWAKVLKVERVGIHNNFFDLGGHSLLLFEVHAKLSELFSREVSMVELFEHPTIHTLVQHFTLKQDIQTTKNRAGNRNTRQTTMSKQREARKKHRLKD